MKTTKCIGCGKTLIVDHARKNDEGAGYLCQPLEVSKAGYVVIAAVSGPGYLLKAQGEDVTFWREIRDGSTDHDDLAYGPHILRRVQ